MLELRQLDVTDITGGTVRHNYGLGQQTDGLYQQHNLTCHPVVKLICEVSPQLFFP